MHPYPMVSTASLQHGVYMLGINDLMRQAQAMQNKMAKLQEELAAKTVEGSSGGGMVRATASGRQEILSITIDRNVVNPDDVDMLQDLILTAVNDSLRLSRELMEQEMAALTGGLKIPGLM